MKHLLLAVSVGVLAAAAWAQPVDATKSADPAKPRAAPTATITGTLTALDVAAGTMSIGGPTGDVKLSLPADTRVLINGDPGVARDLTVGTRVRVTYLSDGPQPYAALLLVDQSSFGIIADEYHGMAATISAIGPPVHDDSLVRTLSLNLANGKKRTVDVSLVSVLLRDGQRVRLDPFSVDDQVWVQIDHTIRGPVAKSMGDKHSYDAYLSEHTAMATVIKPLSDRELLVRFEGNEIVCRTRPGALLINEGSVTSLSGFRRDQTVFIKYVDIVDHNWVVAGVFTADSWRMFATQWDAASQGTYR